MALYELRYFFDTGSGICLWPGNDRTTERFGYAIDLRTLGLPENVILQGEELLVRFDTWMDWNNAPAEIWSESERLSFAEDAQAYLQVLRSCLGTDFDIKDSA
jgi:hypothetical protein